MENQPTRSNSVRKHKHGSLVSDDGTNTFFYRAHTTIALFLTIACLGYVALMEDETSQHKTKEYNTTRGISAAAICFIVFGVTQAKDGPFKRPHPAIWRFILCIGVLYFLALVFLLFQSKQGARELMIYFDPSLNVAPDFTAYGSDCKIYDPEAFPDDPFHNFKIKMDGFVVAHFVGWVFKALMMRDLWMTNVISIMFEFLEYSLEHQLANFSECWWDHWILDFLVCNGGGIVVGMLIMKYLKNKEYNWRGLAAQNTLVEKAGRVVAQFTPYSWVTFHWNATKNFQNWMYVNMVICVCLLSELNTFYLKAVLWIPAGHRIVLIRLWFLVFWGSPAIREFYDYMIGATNTIGQQFWIICAISFTETLIVLKFGKDIISKPFPPFIKSCWIWGFVLYILWSIWKFQVHYHTVKPGSDECMEAEENGDLDPKVNFKVAVRESSFDTDDSESIDGARINGKSAGLRRRKQKAK